MRPAGIWVRGVQGDAADLIAHRELGDARFAVAVLEANRGLAQLGPVIPADTAVILPDAPDGAKIPAITLW